jgi:hypothetical protein
MEGRCAGFWERSLEGGLAIASNEAGNGDGRPGPMGPLVVHPRNPRYFMNSATGQALYLTGSHTWANLQERRLPGAAHFEFDGYLDFLVRHRHSFIRLWAWEHAAWMPFTEERIEYEPHPFLRTGPGLALDGKPRFDLSRFSKGYFDRLRERVIAAAERGLYVSVMLFQGRSVEPRGRSPLANPWHGHPFHKDNNINGINGDPFGDGYGREVHTLAILPIVEIQERYARQVADVLGDLDNVLYEISNESPPGSTKWQYHMIDLLHQHEAAKEMQHPVGMTVQWPADASGADGDLFASPAEWVCPGPGQGSAPAWTDDPPPADGRKVVISDSGHLWPLPGDDQAEAVRRWVWKSFLRGHNPIFADPYLDVRTGQRLDHAWDPVRGAMGLTRLWADRTDLAALEPHGDLASTGYCLAAPGAEYVVYAPEGEPLTLEAPPGRYRCTWFDPLAGKEIERREILADGARMQLEPPFQGEAVLHLKAAGPAAAG